MKITSNIYFNIYIKKIVPSFDFFKNIELKAMSILHYLKRNTNPIGDPPVFCSNKGDIMMRKMKNKTQFLDRH